MEGLTGWFQSHQAGCGWEQLSSRKRRTCTETRSGVTAGLGAGPERGRGTLLALQAPGSAMQTSEESYCGILKGTQVVCAFRSGAWQMFFNSRRYQMRAVVVRG